MTDLARATGVLTVAATAAYFASDVWEGAQGGFSSGQLWLTLVAEAAVPVFVLGLAAVQRPKLGRLGWAGATGYAAAFVYFTYTVAFALVKDTADFESLADELAPIMGVAGGVMVVAGVLFGVATSRAAVLPRWSGVGFAVGVVAVALAVGMPTVIELAAVAVRDVALAAMGVGVLRSRGPTTTRTVISAGAAR